MNVSTDSLQASATLVLSGTEDEVHISPDETVELDGVEILVKYFFKAHRYLGEQSGRVLARLYVGLSQIQRITPRGEWGLIDELGLKAVAIEEWVIVEDGEELFTAPSRWNLKNAYDQWKKERMQASYQAQLDRHKQELVRLESLGRPVDGLRHLIQEASSRIRFFNERWRKNADCSGVITALRSVENEISRIADGGLDLLLDDLMDGKIFHKDVQHNQRVIDQVRVWSIRTGGFVDMITPETLRSFYESRLQGVTRVDELQARNLKMNLADYDPTDLIPELDAYAPEVVSIHGRKDVAVYRVSYDLFEVDGEPVPVGSISIPLSAYERNAAEYGKKSGFPELPHGIRLFIHVTVDRHEIAGGFDDEHLATKVKKYKRSKSRGKAIEGVGIDEFSYKRWSPIQAGEAPPWRVGARIRW